MGGHSIMMFLETFFNHIKKNPVGVPVVAQWLTNPTKNHEVAVQSLALLSGLRIRRCRELWRGLQMRLGSPHCCGSGVGRRQQLRLDP